MYDLITIGSISIDLYFKGESLTFKDGRFQLAVGGKYSPDFFYQGVGGGAVNVALGAKRFGLKAAIFGKIGKNPFKKIITDILDNNNISYNYCQIEDDYYNISSILLTAKGERSIIHYATLHQRIIKDKSDLGNLSRARMVYLGNLPDVSLTERDQILHHLKKNNILTVVNLGVVDCRRKKEQLKDFLSHTDILIVNGYEFADLVKASYKDIHFKDNVIKWYAPFLNEKIVVVTEGSKGSYAYYYGKIYYHTALKPNKMIDTTGAGDAYTAGFISEYFKSKDIKRSMEKATNYATKILGKIGAN